MRVFHLSLLYAASGSAGYAAYLAHVPLPWVIGPLFAACLIISTGRIRPPPVQLRGAAQLVIGLAMGLGMTPAALDKIIDQMGVIVLAGLLTIVAGVLISHVLTRIAPIDRTTAFFASIPGGPVEMANMAQAFGGDPSRVALAQTLRVFLVVLLLPQTLRTLDVDQMPDAGHPFVVAAVPVLLALAAGAVLAGCAARAVRLINPFFLGPLLLTCALAATGAPLPPVPDVVIAAGQVLIGVSIGVLLQDSVFRSAAPTISTMAFAAFLLVLSCIAVAFGLEPTVDGGIGTMLLATAPGGATEMAVTAQAAGQDVALVVAFQVVRIVMIAALLPLAAKSLERFGRANTDRKK